MNNWNIGDRIYYYGYGTGTIIEEFNRIIVVLDRGDIIEFNKGDKNIELINHTTDRHENKYDRTIEILNRKIKILEDIK